MDTTTIRRRIIHQRFLGLCATGLVIAIAGAGCSHNAPAPATPPVPAGPTSVVTAPRAKAEQLVAYKLASSGEGSAKVDANGLIAMPIDIAPGSANAPAAALAEVASGPDSPLPSGTKVLSVTIDGADKTATVDLSKEFKNNFKGGDTREAQAVESVVQTMGQFPNVAKVQFLVAGKKIDSLGGTQELDEPLPTPQSGQQVASSGAGGN